MITIDLTTAISVVAALLLIAFLAAKELAAVAAGSGFCLRMGKSLNVPIIPMVMVFVVIVVARVAVLLG